MIVCVPIENKRKLKGIKSIGAYNMFIYELDELWGCPIDKSNIPRLEGLIEYMGPTYTSVNGKEKVTHKPYAKEVQAGLRNIIKILKDNPGITVMLLDEK